MVLTAALSPLFCLAGLVGPVVGGGGPDPPGRVWKPLLQAALRRGYPGRCPRAAENPPGLRKIFSGSTPRSPWAGIFSCLATITVAAFIARAADPERVLPAYYLALGLANPLAFAATRIQTVMLAFPPTAPFRRRTLRFALAAGLVIGLAAARCSFCRG